MERWRNDMQAILKKVVRNYLHENKELFLNKITGGDGLILTARANKDVHINTIGSGKAYYNGEEIGAVGGGTWGSITGTLSAQTDLQSALDGKAASSHNHDTVYLNLAGGDLMLGNFSMNSNYINGMAYSTDWNSLTNDQAIAKGNITNWMTKAQTPQNNWYFQYGLRLPQGTDALKSATPSEGQAYWATDTDKLYIGKGSDLWKEIGGVTAHSSLTGLTTGDDHTQYLLLTAGSGKKLTGDLYLESADPDIFLNSTGDDTDTVSLSFQRLGTTQASIQLTATTNLLKLNGTLDDITMGASKVIKAATGEDLTLKSGGSSNFIIFDTT